MTRLQGQPAWLWDLSPWLRGRSRDTPASEGRLASEDFSAFCQGLPLGSDTQKPCTGCNGGGCPVHPVTPLVFNLRHAQPVSWEVDRT